MDEAVEEIAQTHSAVDALINNAVILGALNAHTVLFSAELAPRGFKVNSVDPGFTATAFNGYTGERSPEVSAAFVVKAATLGPDGPTGRFLSEETSEGQLPC